MPSPERALTLAWAALGGLAVARPLAAQRQAGLLYGRWAAGGRTIYEARLDRPLAWLRHGPTLNLLLEDRDAERSFYGAGYEVSAPRGSRPLALYGVLDGALGILADSGTQALGALWSVGMGVEWRPVPLFGVTLEERYRITDRGPRGFWHPGDSHRGWGTMLGLSIALGSDRRSAPAVAPASQSSARREGDAGAVRIGDGEPGAGTPPPAEPPLMIVGRGADVVQTALEVIGTPYQWGGTAENGFDCSGLVQYAYARHGIRLPRTSRAQARAGAAVPRDLDSLRAGDILTFAARAGGSVTHVGMYVGNGEFIHSSSTGVKLSRLDPSDPEGGYWIPRWVGVRRILP